MDFANWVMNQEWEDKMIKQIKDWIKIPGYWLRIESITAISDIEEKKKKVVNNNTGKEEEVSFYQFSIFWSSNEAQLFFEDKKAAEDIKSKITEVLIV